MKLETLHLICNGKVEVFTSTDDIPKCDWRIMRVTFDDGTTITW